MPDLPTAPEPPGASGISDSAISVPISGGRLGGTLTEPPSPRGTAVLVSGSGPIDRNSDHKRLALRVMALLADALAAHGWASVRYDKRGVGASSGDYLSTGLWDNIADAERVVEQARAMLPGPVIAVGHSEGAVIATELARRPALLDGAVLLAGMAGTGEETLRWQADQLEGQVPAFARTLMRLMRTSVSKQQDKQLARLKSTTDDVIRMQLVAKVNARWFREFLGYDAQPALQAATVPVLALTGSKDVQVNPADLGRMRASNPRVEAELLLDVDHILRHEPAAVSSPQAYKKQARKPLDPRVIDAVTRWLDQHWEQPERTERSPT
jgi:pimeloyl-ACP methyl ester carboxylesterase